MTQSPTLRVLTEANAGPQALDPTKPLGSAIVQMMATAGVGIGPDPDDPETLLITTRQGGSIQPDAADPDALVFTIG
jgi:hypothetical protein